MVKFRKTLFISLSIAAVLAGGFFLKVSAQAAPMDDRQIELIRNSCTSVKTTLNQLHSSDALLRVNRGQIYESMSTKLMEEFNSRVATNGLNNSSLVNVADDYSTILDVFRSDYINYEKQLTVAIGIDCTKQPVVFYDAVALARTERNQVHSDVVKLNQSIDQYKLSLDQFKKDNLTAIQGEK